VPTLRLISKGWINGPRKSIKIKKDFDSNREGWNSLIKAFNDVNKEKFKNN